MLAKIVVRCSEVEVDEVANVVVCCSDYSMLTGLLYLAQ